MRIDFQVDKDSAYFFVELSLKFVLFRLEIGSHLQYRIGASIRQNLLNLGVRAKIYDGVLVVGKHLFKHEHLLSTDLALGGELMKLGRLGLELLFKEIPLTCVQLVSLFELLDQLSHFVFLHLQASYLLVE